MLGSTILELKVTYRHSEIFYSAHAVVPLITVYYYKYNKDKPDVEPKVLHTNKLKGFDETKYTFEHAFHTVKDGTEHGQKLPIGILFKKSVFDEPLKTKPCWLIGYGIMQ